MLFCIVTLSARGRRYWSSQPCGALRLIPILTGCSVNSRSPEVKSSGWICRQVCSQWPTRESNSGPAISQSQAAFQSSTTRGNVSERQQRSGWGGNLDSSISRGRDVPSQTWQRDPMLNPFWKPTQYFSQCSNRIAHFFQLDHYNKVIFWVYISGCVFKEISNKTPLFTMTRNLTCKGLFSL